MTMFPYLRGMSPAVHHRLNRLAVFRYPFSDRLVVSKIVADAVPREYLRRYQARADIPAVITQHEFVKPRLPNGPVFPGWHEDRLARRASRPAKNKGVDAVAFEHLDIRQLARLFFYHDRRESASSETNGDQQNKEKFEAHRNEVETV